MFNPFKKKDDSYKLDEMSLPSMSSQGSNLQSLDTTTNQQGNINSNISSPNFDNHPASVDNYENTQMAQDQPYNENKFPSQNIAPMNSFSNSSYDQQPNSYQPSSLSQSSIQNENTSNSLNTSSDISAVQLETLDKKMSLLDTRISIMEDKINKIYEMLTLEVSEDTRTKVHVNIDKSKIYK